MDAIAAAQVLSEIGYLLRQDPKEVFRAKAFSAAAWTLAVERPDLDALHTANKLTTIEGVGAGIAKVLAGLVETGRSSYLERLRAETGQPAREDESIIDPTKYQGDLHSATDWSDGPPAGLARRRDIRLRESVSGGGAPRGRPGDRLRPGANGPVARARAPRPGMRLQLLPRCRRPCAG